MAKAPLFLVSLSGGLDSTVLCANLIARHGAGAVAPVFFEYGSKHNLREKQAALAVAAHFGVRLAAVDLSAAFAHVQSALLSSDPRDIPQNAYDRPSMNQTAVPGRNLIFGSVMAAIAESSGIAAVALATHSGDHHLYPDCRPAFNAALQAVVEQSTESKVRVLTPFSRLTKSDLVRMGLALAAPLHLTRSCYGAEELSCGKCGTCRERLAAFAENGAKDPVSYKT